MVKAVLDTNVLISAFIFGGNSRTILEHVIRGNIRLAISDPLLDEIKRVLSRPKFNYPPEIIQLIINELLLLCDFVVPRKEIANIQSDPEDNRVLECAIESDADFIVTGDSHLLQLESHERIEIVNPSQFCLLMNL